MKVKINLQTRLYLSGAIILLIGLGTSAVIYLRTADADTRLGYELEESKQDIRDLELYGGKMNVLTVELNKWFKGLWQGRSLAYTLCCLTILISAILFLVADHWPSDLEDDNRSAGRRG